MPPLQYCCSAIQSTGGPFVGRTSARRYAWTPTPTTRWNPEDGALRALLARWADLRPSRGFSLVVAGLPQPVEGRNHAPENQNDALCVGRPPIAAARQRSQVTPGQPTRRLLGSRLGEAVIRVYLNMLAVPPSPATAALDATYRAGRLADFSLRIQRHGRLSGAESLAFANFANLSEQDLRLWALEALAAAGTVIVRRDSDGRLLELEEQIGVGIGVLEQTAALWERFAPDDVETATIASADQLAYVPMTESDHRGYLVAFGHAERLHARAFSILAHLGLLRRERSARLKEDIIYSPYVWGSEAVPIGEFLHNLPANEREIAAELHRAVADRPGVTVSSLPGGRELVDSARKVGLIHATRVVTSTGQEQAFAFSPALERQLAPGRTDVANDRKLFTAHILYGHQFGFPGTGRIADPVVLVRALINRGTVGPATAIATDYPSLEARGIVAVEGVAGTRMANLRLVRSDVAEDSLRLLEQALGQTRSRSDIANSVSSLWVPGVSFVSPEQDRHAIRVEPGASMELMNSLVGELREAAARRLRGEWN